MILEAAISGFGGTPPGYGQVFDFGRCVHGASSSPTAPLQRYWT